MYDILIKRHSNSFTIKSKQTTVQVTSYGKRGIQGIQGPVGPTGPQGEPGDPASNIVESVNGKIGQVVLETDDIDDSTSSHKFVTAAEVTLINSASQPGDNISLFTNDANFISDLSTFDTGDLAEGSNLYYTNTRVDARIALQAGVANGLATLGSDGKIPTSQLPALAITDTFVVASQAAMLALTAEVGDIAVRTDQNKSYILKTAGASTLGNWQELLTPTDTVLSVNGQTGAVSLTTTNISEGTNLYYTTARVQTDGDARYLKLAGGTMTGKLTMNVSGDFAIDLGTSAMKANKIVVDGTPRSFAFPYTINAYQPEVFIYLDSQYHIMRIGAQYPSDITAIAFELPNNNEYQDVMALSKTSLAPAAALTNSIALGNSNQKWKSIFIGTDPSTIQGTLTLGSLSGVLKASAGLISGSATTTDLTEGTNLYYTTARVNSAFDTRLATKSTSDLAEGSNLYYTDERVDDRVAALLVAGSGITLSYNDAGNALTISASAGAVSATPSDVSTSGPSVSMTAGENVAFGDVCYVKSDGKLWKADADAIATAGALFMATATILADASGTFALPGSFARNDAGWNWTVGGMIYLSGTAGALTQTQPTATNAVVQVLGVATHADRMFFYPQLVQIELN